MEVVKDVEIIATNSREQWEAMEGADQLKILKCMAWKAKEAAAGHGYAWVEIFSESDAAATVASEAWIILTEALKREDLQEMPLAILAYRAAAAAAQKIYNNERRHISALTWDEEAAQMLIDTQANAMGERTATPEEHAEAMEAIEEAAHDQTDRVIIQMIIAGYTQKEIAARLAITPAAVNKRVKAIQKRG